MADDEKMAQIDKRQLAEINVKMDGVRASVEIWVVAIYSALSAEQKRHVLEWVPKMRAAT